MLLNNTLEETIGKAKTLPVAADRIKELQKLIDYIQSKKGAGKPALLNYICTHNSRRSQLAQIWSQTLGTIAGLDIQSYSGGVEVTAFNDRAIASIERAGFQVKREGFENPKVYVQFTEQAAPIVAFSKTYDDPANPKEGFAAIMTCSHADDNCPFIPGAEVRIPLTYEDPKEFDGIDIESRMYDERSMQIASELHYVFSKIK